jgi:hypothetical protein
MSHLSLQIGSLITAQTRKAYWIPARACRIVLIHSGGLSAGQLKSALPNAFSWRRKSTMMGTPDRVFLKCAIRSHRACQGAPCPIATRPTGRSDRSRFRAAFNPKTETTGCPSDWRISSRIDKTPGRNSTWTMAVTVLQLITEHSFRLRRLT